MQVERMFLDDIRVGERLRPLDQQRVDALADSMNALGLQTPISVWTDTGEYAVLVAGNHRLAAAKKLGWKMIDCVFVEMSETDRRLWEISENLHRAELTKLERDEHIAEWVRLTDEKVRNLSAPSGGKQPAEEGKRAASRELGVDEKAVRNAVKVASIAPEAKEAARECGIDDNQSALLKVAAVEPSQQAAFVRQYVAQDRRASRAEDKDLGEEAAEKVAALIAEHVPGEFWEGIKANLYATNTKAIARALTRLTGVAVFDKGGDWK